MPAVGYRHIRFDSTNQAVELTKPGMLLDLGGIAKGYAIEEALKILRQEGIPTAMIHAGGDIALGDPPPGKIGWNVAIAPLQAGAKPDVFLLLANRFLATSGDTVQFTVIEGRRYSHIVDPKTGIGLTDHGIVSVAASDGMTADALATALCVLGIEKGMKLAEDASGVAARIVRVADGRPREYLSSRWKDILKSGPAP